MITQIKAGTIRNFSSTASVFAGPLVFRRKFRLRAAALIVLTAIVPAAAQERPLS